MISFSLTFDGTVESFGTAEQTAFKTGLATTLAAGIQAEDIRLVIASGSVVVNATIIVRSGSVAALQAAATLTTAATNTTALSASLGVAVTAVTTPTVGSAVAQAPSPPPPLPPPFPPSPLPTPPFYCGPGTKVDPNSASSCLACESGKYSDGLSATECSDCPAGRYCPPAGSSVGASAAVPCPGGTYSTTTLLTAASQCIDVAAGFYAPLGSTAAIACPSGATCPGRANDDTNAEVCTHHPSLILYAQPCRLTDTFFDSPWQ